MRYNPRATLDPSQLGGGGGRGRGVAVGGGLGGIVVLLLAVFFGPGILGDGTDPSAVDPGANSNSSLATCTRGADISSDRNCRFVAYTNSIQAFWATQFRSGEYQKIQVKPFTGSISTGCGNATSAVGPFYCSNDTSVYLDFGFFDQLKSEFGAKGGDPAEAYVIAHEFGHHIQHLTGTMERVQRQGDNSGADSGSVRLELQADCYAGVWFRHATDDPNSPIAEVTQDDLDTAVDAAETVGDDRIQKKMQGQVSPESFTHGTSAQRHKWLQQGFSTGEPNTCNTFSAATL
jgi:predicted metalloprotease